jgi:hypothetical protein
MIKLSMCLISYHVMRTYLMFNEAPLNEFVWVNGVYLHTLLILAQGGCQ